MKAGQRKLRVTVTVEDYGSSGADDAPNEQGSSQNTAELVVNCVVEFIRWLFWWLPWIAR